MALAGPFLYALTNHIDKVLLEKYFKEGGVGALMLFSSLLSALALPVILYLDPLVLDVSLFNVAVLLFVSLLYVALLWFYFLALDEEEASVVIVFYQLVPVFGLILGYFILGEVLTQAQLFAMAVIILGTTIVAFELDGDNKFKINLNWYRFIYA